MEYTPEHLPPPHRRESTRNSERIYRFHYSAKQVHPFTGFLIGLAGLAVFGVMLVFFFWFALIALALGVVAFVIRSLLNALRR